MSNYLSRVKECVESIQKEEYFLPIWEKVKHQKPLELCTDEELLEPFQNFWDSLPDHRGIRRYPFFKICDLAEDYMSLGSDEEDDEWSGYIDL